jgi:hypothetical protein
VEQQRLVWVLLHLLQPQVRIQPPRCRYTAAVPPLLLLLQANTSLAVSWAAWVGAVKGLQRVPMAAAAVTAAAREPQRLLC